MRYNDGYIAFYDNELLVLLTTFSVDLYELLPADAYSAGALCRVF